MSKSRVCQSCLYPEHHPLGLIIEDGLCTGCLIHREKDEIDWNERLIELRKLVKPYQDNKQYDCIVPVCGGQDSFFIVHVVKKILGLTPLLVSFNRLYNTALGIQNLEHLRTRFGCDILSYNPNPKVARNIQQATATHLGSFHWYYLAGSTVFPVQMAARMGIPLIIWGAHQGVDQVGMFSHHDRVEMTRRYRKEHDLLGFEPEDLVDVHPCLDESSMRALFYPTDSELLATGVRGIYLNHYFRWDSKAQHEKMMQLYGYQTQKQARTFDAYHDNHCMHYNGVHDLVKQYKFGFGKVTDQVCREIRLKRISRSQGVSLVQAYEQTRPSDCALFEQQLGMRVESLLDANQNLRALSLAKASPQRFLETLKQPKVNDLAFAKSFNATCEVGPSQYRTLMRGYSKPFEPAKKIQTQPQEVIA